MKKLSKAETIIKYLIENEGAEEVSSNSRRYRKFTRPGTNRFYYVGKMGAIRSGRTATDSISLTAKYEKLLFKV